MCFLFLGFSCFKGPATYGTPDFSERDFKKRQRVQLFPIPAGLLSVPCEHHATGRNKQSNICLDQPNHVSIKNGLTPSEPS